MTCPKCDPEALHDVTAHKGITKWYCDDCQAQVSLKDLGLREDSKLNSEECKPGLKPDLNQYIPVDNELARQHYIQSCAWQQLANSWKDLARFLTPPHKPVDNDKCSDLELRYNLPIWFRRARPCFYTEYEGGQWRNWTEGNVDIIDPKKDWNEANTSFHALAFGSVTGGIFPRWDEVNGWTMTFEEALKQWKYF